MQKITRSEAGGIIVIAGCLLLVLAAWFAWGKIGDLSAVGVFLIIYGIGGILADRQREAKFNFDKMYAAFVEKRKQMEIDKEDRR